MIRIRPGIRRQDRWGRGEFDAPRGDRTHRGEDYEALPGATVYAVASGTVTKLGYAYADDLQYRYVEITAPDGFAARYMYVAPAVGLYQRVARGEELGEVQDIAARYPGITPHFHFEVRDDRGAIMHPQEYFKQSGGQHGPICSN